MKKLVLACLLLSSVQMLAKTVTAVAISPQGAAVVSGSSFQFSVTCTYSDASTDDCTAAGGATWDGSHDVTNYMSVSATGLATWHTDPYTIPNGQGGFDTYANGFVLVSAGGFSDRAMLFAQHSGDIWYQYPTPDYHFYATTTQPTRVYLPLNVAVGSTIAVGEGFTINNSGATTGGPFQDSCTWVSSFPTVATVARSGLVTAVSSTALGDGGVAGKVTITCNEAGNAVFQPSATAGWQSPGNYLQLTVVAGGTSNQTWYVRPDGGLPYINSTVTPSGQCDGLSDLPAAGATAHHCAMGNPTYLWLDQTTYYQDQWMISGGDTVIIRQKSGGYPIGPDSGGGPVNCSGAGSDCYMPTIPSGTSTRHTRILGENYASCTSDPAKTLMLSSYGERGIFNTIDSQFVDVACFEITDSAACAGNTNYTNKCPAGSNAGADGILESALTASVNYTDIFIHGLADNGIYGATGAGVVANRIHFRAMPDAGIEMDDDPWGNGNTSVAGGFTMNNSITEFTGCVEEYPVVHNYPYIECRGGNQGGYADGFGTANTTGDWSFDHDIWRSNLQDGLDLLHSGMQTLSITNSISEHNNGQTYKVGSGRTVVFQNNIALDDCNRNALLYGDEPATAIVANGDYCRANDGLVFAIDSQGSINAQNNTYIGVHQVVIDINCLGPFDTCLTADTRWQNNIMLAYGDYNSLAGAGVLPAAFFSADASTVPNGTGFLTRDHNIYYNVKLCPTLNTGEACPSSPLFTVQYGNSIVPTPISNEAAFDTVTEALTSGSPAKFAGITISGTSPDMNGTPRATPNPSMGALEFVTNPSTAPIVGGSGVIGGSATF